MHSQLLKFFFFHLLCRTTQEKNIQFKLFVYEPGISFRFYSLGKLPNYNVLIFATVVCLENKSIEKTILKQIN